MTACMSTSLKVVSIAAVCCASTRRDARCWRAAASSARAARCAAHRSSRQRLRRVQSSWTGGAAVASRLLRCGSAARLLSSRDRLCRCRRRTRVLTPCSAASLRAAGLTLAASRSTGAAAFGADSQRPLPSPLRPSAVSAMSRSRLRRRDRPLPRTTPCRRLALDDLRASVPSAGATISSTTLSVSMSTSTSSRFAASPGCLCQVATVPSAIDSGEVGAFISIAVTRSSFFVFLVRVGVSTVKASSTRRACCSACSCM